MSGPRSLILFMAALAVGGCFRDETPLLGCEAQACGDSSAGATSTTGTGQDPPETTTQSTGTTGEPEPAGRAFRINSLALVEPHMFFGEGMCADGTSLLNDTLQMNIDDGNFNIVLKFATFTPGGDLKPELIEVENCDLTAKTCVPKPGQVSLQIPAEEVADPPCSQLDTTQLSKMNVPSLNDPQPPCLRTVRAELALPFEGAAVPINLRESQVVFNFDVADDPQEVQNGLLYGFLTQQSAEATMLDILGMPYVLWPLIDAPTCTDQFPELLPAVDTLMDGDQMISGVWLAANFTATRVELLDAP